MMDLLQAFGIDWRLLGIQVLNFGILLGALWFFLYKPVLKMLGEREKMIEKGVLDAKAAAEAHEEITATRQDKLRLAEQEAQGIVAGAKKLGQDEKSKIVKDAEARAEQIAQDAALRAKEAERKALLDAEREIARLAILAAEKVLVKK